MKKVAIVTGASRGIGAGIAKELANQGYSVCINYNNNALEAEKIVADITALNGEAFAYQADLSNEADIITLFEETDRRLGSVQVLVNNAGTNGGICEVEHITMAHLQTVYQLNVFGTFLASREAVKRMKTYGGSIINVTSEAAKFGGHQLSHYASSKAAINTFTIGFAREVAAHHIRVNAVSPGVIDTDMHMNSPKERVNALVNSLPMKRMGQISEVAKLVAWLASDDASYVSGAIIPVAGAR